MNPYFEKKSANIFTSYYTETYNYPAHFHSYLEVAFCLSGMQNIKIGEKIYTLKTGDAVVIFPNMVHEYIAFTQNQSDTARIYAFICDTRIFAETLPDIATKLPANPFICADSISRSTADAFQKIVNTENNLEMIGWAYIILSDILQKLRLVPIEGNLELPSKIIAYIDENFKENLSIGSIAKALGYHPSYIAHIFCDRLNIPFKTYLCGVRCEYAASQIQSTDKNLTEIAYDTGYSSLNTFCRCFKKHFAQTPSQYKKSYKQKK